MRQTLLFLCFLSDPSFLSDPFANTCVCFALPQTILRTTLALQAANLGMRIMTTPDISRKLVMEDVLEYSIQLVKNHTLHSLLPLYDPNFRSQSAIPSSKLGGDQSDQSANQNGEEEEEQEAPKKPSRRKSMKGASGVDDPEDPLAKYSASCREEVEGIAPKVLTVIEYLGRFFRMEKVQDRHADSLRQVCVAILQCERPPSSAAMQPLQMTALR